MEQAAVLTLGLIHLGSALFGYACGLLPTGQWLTRSRGIDLRASGSGNPGATNVLRTAGLGLGIATLLGDSLKAALPTWTVWVLTTDIACASSTGFAAVVGHCFPVTHRGRGGKGVASALGVLAVLAPPAAGLAVAVFAGMVRWREIVSVASLTASVAACAVTIALGSPRPVVLCGAAMTALIWTRHHANLRRLRAGTEPRIALPEKQASA